MRNAFVFILWVFATTFSFLFLMGPWMLFVSLPMLVWYMYRDTNVHDIKEWTMPYYPIYFVSDKIRKLHVEDKSPTREKAITDPTYAVSVAESTRPLEEIQRRLDTLVKYCLSPDNKELPSGLNMHADNVKMILSNHKYGCMLSTSPTRSTQLVCVPYSIKGEPQWNERFFVEAIELSTGIDSLLESVYSW